MRRFSLFAFGAVLVAVVGFVAQGSPAGAAGSCSGGDTVVCHFTQVGPARFHVPDGVTSLYIDASAGGGGGISDSPVGGGTGARVLTNLPVTPGTTLDLYVGGGGTASPIGGSGGGATTVTRPTDANPSLVAGGGGGAVLGHSDESGTFYLLGGAGGFPADFHGSGDTDSGYLPCVGATGGQPGSGGVGGSGGGGVGLAGGDGFGGKGGDSASGVPGGSGVGSGAGGAGSGGGGGGYGGGGGGGSVGDVRCGAGGGGGSLGPADSPTENRFLQADESNGTDGSIKIVYSTPVGPTTTTPPAGPPPPVAVEPEFTG